MRDHLYPGRIKAAAEALLEIILPRRRYVRALARLTAADLDRETTTLPRPRRATVKKDVIALFNYRSPLVRTLIRELKYRGSPDAVRLLGDVLREELLDILADAALFRGFESPLLIPVPLSEIRRRQRGFNQLHLLVEYISPAGESGFAEPRLDVLVKHKETKAQTETASRGERLANLKDAFGVRAPETIRGRDVILLDDVYTTGSTLDEAKRALTRSGAREVISVAIAH